MTGELTEAVIVYDPRPFKEAQELAAEVRELEAENAALKAELDELRGRVQRALRFCYRWYDRTWGRPLERILIGIREERPSGGRDSDVGGGVGGASGGATVDRGPDGAGAEPPDSGTPVDRVEGTGDDGAEGGGVSEAVGAVVGWPYVEPGDADGGVAGGMTL